MMERRNFLYGMAVTLGSVTALSAKVPQGLPPFDASSHDGRQSERYPDRDPRPKPDPRRWLAENQKNLRRDANDLLKLAQDLKTEADKTDQTDVLSLSLIHKAEDIEKLAKHIRSLARSA